MLLDRLRGGTHNMDSVSRIENVCINMRILSHRDDQGRVHMDVTPDGDIIETPQYTRYGFEVAPHVYRRFMALADEFAGALNVASVRVIRDGGLVYVEVPNAQETVALYADVMAMDTRLDCGEVLLGLTSDGEQLTLYLPSPRTVHALVVGMTGSGKSNLMRVMALSAITHGTQVALFDPSGGLEPLSGHPRIWRGGLFRDYGDIERGLGVLAKEIGRNREGDLLIIVDEVPDLAAANPAIRDHLSRLTQAGRNAGLHLIAGAQHALASEIGTTIMQNTPTRIVARVASPTASYNATGRRGVGAESLRGNGDFILAVGGTERRFQAAFLPDSVLADFARQYPPRSPRLPVTPRMQQQIVSDGVPGRPTEEPDTVVIARIRDYVQRQGALPSSNWVYRVSRDAVGAGYGREKAERAMSMALGEGAA